MFPRLRFEALPPNPWSVEEEEDEEKEEDEEEEDEDEEDEEEDTADGCCFFGGICSGKSDCLCQDSDFHLSKEEDDMATSREHKQKEHSGIEPNQCAGFQKNSF